MDAARETLAQMGLNPKLSEKLVPAENDKISLYPVLTGTLCHWENPGLIQAVYYLAIAQAQAHPMRELLPWVFTGLGHLHEGLEGLRPVYPNAGAGEQITAQVSQVYRELFAGFGFPEAPPTRPLSERQRKAAALKAAQQRGDLYRVAFQIGWLARGSPEHLDEVATAGAMLGLCAEILAEIEGNTVNPEAPKESEAPKAPTALLCTAYSHNELIDLFTSSLNTFGKTCVRFKLFTPALKELYTLFIARFKKSLTI